MRLSNLIPTALALFLLTPAIPRAEEPKLDCHGDPLPSGAIARLGTVRWRHADGTELISFLPDGRTLLSVGLDLTVRKWDVATGKELRRFRLKFGLASDGRNGIHDGVRAGSDVEAAPRTIALSANGKVLAVDFISSDATVHVWDTATGKEIRRITVAGGHAVALALTNDGKRIAVHDSDGTIRLHETATGKEIGRFAKKIDKANQLAAAHLAIAPDGDKLAAVSWRSDEKANVTLWDTATGKERSPVFNSEQVQQYTPIHFSPDGKWVAWNARSGIMFADVATVKDSRHLKFGLGKRARVFSDFLFTPDSKTLIAWEGFGGHFHIWDVATGKHLREFRGPKPESSGLPENWRLVAISSDGKLLALGGATGAICLLDVAKGAEIPGLDAPREAITCVSFARDGKQVFTTEERPIFRVWDAASGKPLQRFAAPHADDDRSVLSDDGQLLVTIGHLGTLHLRAVATSKELPGIATGMRHVGRVAVSPDSKLIAVAGTKSKREPKELVAVYDIGGQLHHRFTLTTAPSDPAVSEATDSPSADLLRFAPDGRTLATLLSSGEVALWDGTTGRQLPTIPAPKDAPMYTLAFSWDGRSLALDAGGIVRLYELATGQERCRFDVHAAGAKNQAVGDPAGAQTAAFAVKDNQDFSTRPLALSPDGKRLAHGRPGGIIALWDVVTRKELGQLRGHQADVISLAFSTDGRTLASGSLDTTVLLWDMTKYAAMAKPQVATVDAAARWNELRSDDAARAFDAICALAAAPGQSVPFLKEHLRPAAAVDAAKVQRLIGELDSEQFAVRKKATADLEQIGEPAIPLLRKALARDPTPEPRKRIEEVLKKVDRIAPSGELRRSLRAVEVLEMIATPESKAVLKKIAKGTADATLTRAAQAALERLSR